MVKVKTRFQDIHNHNLPAIGLDQLDFDDKNIFYKITINISEFEFKVIFEKYHL